MWKLTVLLAILLQACVSRAKHSGCHYALTHTQIANQEQVIILIKTFNFILWNYFSKVDFGNGATGSFKNGKGKITFATGVQIDAATFATSTDGTTYTITIKTADG